MVALVRMLHALEADIHRSAYFTGLGQCDATAMDTSDVLAGSSHVSDTQCTMACLVNCKCLVVDHCQIGGVSRCFQRHNESSAPCSPGNGCDRWELKVSSMPILLKVVYPSVIDFVYTLWHIVM
jgi:hypothetical protein